MIKKSLDFDEPTDTVSGSILEIQSDKEANVELENDDTLEAIETKSTKSDEFFDAVCE